MKIAIVSDIHENFHNLILALEEIKSNDVEFIICLGDLMNAGIANILSIQDLPVFMIWGNNDGEIVDIVKLEAKENSQLSVSNRTYDFLELDGKRIFISHYDDLALPMATSGLYDAVFYGHNHTQSIEKINNCWLVNPGEICAQKTGISSYAVYDIHTDQIEIKEIENSITLKSDLVSAYLSKHKDRLAFRSAAVFKM